MYAHSVCHISSHVFEVSRVRIFSSEMPESCLHLHSHCQRRTRTWQLKLKELWPVPEGVKGVERDCDLDLRVFACKVVLSVLGKDKTPTKDIAQAFTREMTGESVTAAPTTGTSTAASSEVQLGNTIGFTAGRSSDVGKMTLLHHGFYCRLDCAGNPKASAERAHPEGHLFKISFISSDGTDRRPCDA